MAAAAHLLERGRNLPNIYLFATVLLSKNKQKLWLSKIHVIFCIVFGEIRILFAILLPLLLLWCEKLCWEEEEREEEDDKQTGIEAISPERK